MNFDFYPPDFFAHWTHAHLIFAHWSFGHCAFAHRIFKQVRGTKFGGQKSASQAWNFVFDYDRDFSLYFDHNLYIYYSAAHKFIKTLLLSYVVP